MTEANYKHIIESSTEYAIFTMDLNGVIDSWNTGAERLLGWSENEAIGRHSKIIFPGPEAKQLADKEIQDAHQSGSATDERWHVKKDGKRFWAIGRMMSITDDNGKIIGSVKILLDQTDRKQYEQNLKQVNETLESRVEERTAALLSYQDKLRSLASELNKAEARERSRLAGELHDNLGQILAVCRMELELLQKQLQEKKVDIDISGLKELLDDAIKYTRELMSELKPPADLNRQDLVTMMNWLKSKMKKHDLDVVIVDDNKSKPLSQEMRDVLLQSVRELLFNVIKHAGVNKAQVILKRLDHKVEITVKDSGKGFDPKQLDLPKTETSGFGLFNIRERLGLLEGDLQIESVPGKGTEVKLIASVEN